MQTYAVIFSPTGASRRGAEAVASACGPMTVVDATCRPADPRHFSSGELVVFGAPVYGGRVYQGALRRFSALRGENTPCIVTVTYGNRDFDDALLELADFVRERGFLPIAGAALVGEHTYGSIQVGRPLPEDLEEDRAFAEKALEKLNFESLSFPDFPGNRPYREGGSGGRFRPQTTEACSQCGLCRDSCPTQALAQDCRTVDGARCISCFRCIKTCPVKAKNCDNEEYNAFAAAFTQKLAARRENAYFW